MTPAVYLSHDAPPLVDDALWVSQQVIDGYWMGLAKRSVELF